MIACFDCGRRVVGVKVCTNADAAHRVYCAPCTIKPANFTQFYYQPPWVFRMWTTTGAKEWLLKWRRRIGTFVTDVETE
jgi:hypothetical protein